MSVRKKADAEKLVLMAKVETMKKAGNFDMEELSKMGINIKPEMFGGDLSQSSIMDRDDSIKASNRSKSQFAVNTRDNLQKSHKQQLERTIAQEQKNKQMREESFQAANDPKQKTKLK